MKKMDTYSPFFLVLAVVALTGIGCASSAPPPAKEEPQPDIPGFVMNSPVQEDAIFGVGIAKLSNDNQSMQMAEARARQSLAQQLSTNVQAMITDYSRSAGTENSRASLEFSEMVGRQLTQTTLKGAVPKERYRAKDGTWYVLIALSKNDAARAAADVIENEASQYAEFKAMDALKMMEQQLDRIDTKPVLVDN